MRLKVNFDENNSCINTKDKVMIKDVSIEIIPLAKVINLSNGYTVTIG